MKPPITLITSCVITLSIFSFVAAKERSIVQQGRPLTTSQLEQLIAVPTPDITIALEIDRHSVDFDINEETLERFRKLGAGSLTIAALARQKNRSHRSISKILVADFRGVDNENVGLYEMLLQQLRDSIGSYSDVEIEPLGRSITAEQGRDTALKEGREHNASIVLWGWFVKSPVEGRVNAYVEILRSPRVATLQSSRREYAVGVNEFNEFTLQGKLSKDLTCISLVVTALARMDLLDYQGAISRLTEALDIGASGSQLIDTSDIYVFRALAYFYQAADAGTDTLGNAKADTDEAIKLNDKNTTAYLLRSYVLLNKGDIDEALVEGHKLLDRMETQRDKALVYEFLVSALAQQGPNERETKNDQIHDYSRKLLSVTENVTPPTAEVFQLRAKAFEQLSKQSDAIASLRAAQQLKPDNILGANLHFYLGSLLQNQGRYTEALKEFQAAIKIDPRWINAYVQTGNTLFWMKQYPEAIRNYDIAIKLAPRDSIQYSNRGNAYQESGNVQKAYEDYAKALELDPKNDAAYYNRASLYSANHQIDEALRDLNRCLEIYPKYIDALYLRAEINFKKQLYDLSIEDYTTVIGTNSRDSDAFFSRGNSEQYKGDSDRALEDYNQAIVLSPRYAAPYLGRAIIYASRFKTKEAISDLTHALEYTDDRDIRQRAQQELNKLRTKN